eukprot:GEMP01027063.1.p1 GENE.GEMP01027063.1~~GEMP01027063.1.p1  ORF type:complete len:201 (+),score=33.93 GEMP01027063.1:323-925(+)
MDREVFAFVVDIMRRWAIFLGVPATELVNFLPCTNVTTALSTVTRSWIKSGWHGKVVHLDVAYGTTKKVLRYAAEQTDSRCVEVPTVFDDAAIIRALEEYCVDAAFVVLDHITSNTAAALPIQIRCTEDPISGRRTVINGCVGRKAQRPYIATRIAILPSSRSLFPMALKQITCRAFIGRERKTSRHFLLSTRPSLFGTS